MNAAERILLSLDAHECWGGARLPSGGDEAAGAVELPAIRHEVHDAFGGLIDYKSIGDLRDLVAQTQARVAELDRWYGQASPIWVNKNSAAFVAFTNDRVAFRARIDPAMAKAQQALTVAKFSIMTPDALIGATDEYTGIMKAMRQCYPPDGCTIAKGDWVDLFNRAAAVAPSLGIAVPTDKAIQPTAADISSAIFAATSGIDVVAQVTGAQSTATGPLPQGAAEAIKKGGGQLVDAASAGAGDTFNMLVWLVRHQRELLIGAAVVAGGIGLLSIMPMLMLPAKVAKGAALLAA